VPDRPGELAKLLGLLGGGRVNVMSVEHHREGVDIPINETEVELTLLTRDPGHCDEVVATMEGWGYGVERVR
jgi:threonine dehydratase